MNLPDVIKKKKRKKKRAKTYKGQKRSEKNRGRHICVNANKLNEGRKK